MNNYSSFRRHKIGLTKKTMSEMIGVSTMTINRFEQDASFGGVSPEMVEKVKQKYDEIGKYFSTQNRESYMTYIRSYLDQSHIGLVEFSRMCKTATDIYRRPNKRSYVLATAEQIMHIQNATGIKYDDVLGFGDGRRKKSNAPEPIIAKELEPVDIPEEDKPALTEEALRRIICLPSDILGKTEVTVDSANKHVECTTLGYSAECVGPDHVIYKKKIKRVITEVIEVEIPADEFAKIMKGETA